MTDNTPERRGALTEREFTLACEIYAKTGSKAAAILALSGGATDAEGRPSRRRTLEEALQRNPEWAQRWEDAKYAALGTVEAEIAKAALTVDERPIFDKSGKLLGVQRDSRPRNDMLKFLARTSRSPPPAARRASPILGMSAPTSIASAKAQATSPNKWRWSDAWARTPCASR